MSMRAYVLDGVVVGIYAGNDHNAPQQDGYTVVELSGETGYPSPGWTYNGKTFEMPISKPVEVTLEQLQEAAIKTIDLEAHALQKLLIGDNSFQLSIYSAKNVDGKAWQLKAYGTELDAYKWIKAETRASGQSADAVAAKFVALYGTLLDRLTTIEEHRVFGKAAVRASDTKESIREAKTEALREFAKVREAV